MSKKESKDKQKRLFNFILNFEFNLSLAYNNLVITMTGSDLHLLFPP